MAIEHGGDIFALARSNGWDWREVLDFSASINPLGPAPGVRSAICSAIDRIAHYPEREPARLRASLAHRFELSEEQIILGNGATELLFFAARIFAASPVTLALPVFSEFHRAFSQAAFTNLDNPESWAKQGLLVLTRPANPTGRSFSLQVLEQHLSASSGFTLVDESFLEFSRLPSAATLLNGYENLILLRSLTKFYALPGLRIGALIASAPFVQTWRKGREPWQVNVLAEEAAIAALADEAHAQRSLDFMQSERRWLHAQIANLPGVEPNASDGNFLYVRLHYEAACLCEYLMKKKILIRNCTNWPGLAGQAVRIAVRTRPENEKLLAAWQTLQHPAP